MPKILHNDQSLLDCRHQPTSYITQVPNPQICVPSVTEAKGIFLVTGNMFKSYADKLKFVVIEDTAKVCKSH